MEVFQRMTENNKQAEGTDTKAKPTTTQQSSLAVVFGAWSNLSIQLTG